MTCNLRVRKDDIPKKSKREKTYWCPDCDALIFAERKPVCRKVMQAKIAALHAFAEADDLENHREKTP